MTTPDDGPDLKVLTAESHAIWNQNAGQWDDYMGPEGNQFHRLLVAPSAERLLQIRPGEEVLEIACGAGLFARRLAELGARVVATDFSEVFLERARMRCEGVSDRIELRLLDATDAESLSALEEGRFDAVVSNMALMDIADIEPLAASLPKLLKPSGRFVFTICHPCFNHSGIAMVAEQRDSGGGFEVTYSIRVSRYLSHSVDKGTGIPGQQIAQYYFDRPLHRLLGPFFAAGLVLDAIEEPAFDESVPSREQTRWGGNFHEIPPVLAVRLRPR
jgi:ubiquinone/menaquinone biosynthesis C-methylase UbiE